jgi:hypothetical protein
MKIFSIGTTLIHDLPRIAGPSWEERLMRILDIFVQVQNNHLPVLRPVTHRISLEEEPDVKVVRVQ